MPRPTAPDPELAVALRVMREERGITRGDLARRCRITTDSLAQIESGQHASPWRIVRRLVRELGVGAAELGVIFEVQCPSAPSTRVEDRRFHELRRRRAHRG